MFYMLSHTCCHKTQSHPPWVWAVTDAHTLKASYRSIIQNTHTHTHDYPFSSHTFTQSPSLFSLFSTYTHTSVSPGCLSVHYVIFLFQKNTCRPVMHTHTTYSSTYWWLWWWGVNIFHPAREILFLYYMYLYPSINIFEPCQWLVCQDLSSSPIGSVGFVMWQFFSICIHNFPSCDINV